MPCYDGRSSGIEIRQPSDYQHLVRATCMFCRRLESEGERIPNFLQGWWAMHKAQDAARVSRLKAELEQAIKSIGAFTKLTQQEIETLSLTQKYERLKERILEIEDEIKSMGT